MDILKELGDLETDDELLWCHTIFDMISQEKMQRTSREKVEEAVLPFLDNRVEAAELPDLITRLIDAYGINEVLQEVSTTDKICDIPNFQLMYGGGSKMLLRNTRLLISRHAVYGIVGKNGAGKSTLMNQLSNNRIVELSKQGINCHLVAPEVLEEVGPTTTAYEYCHAQSGASAQDLINLQFPPEFQNKPISELSGGWKMRLLLATAMAFPHNPENENILLLDEPTNHVDEAGVHWIVDFLNSLRDKQIFSAVIVVTHDSAFLDRTCTDTILFENEQLTYFEGNFSRFLEKCRNMPKDELLVTIHKNQSQVFNLILPVPGKVDGVSSVNKTILNLENCAFAYGKGAEILQNVNVKLSGVSRVGVQGVNGAGKSTLLGLISGDLLPTSGQVNRHRNLRLATVCQGHRDDLMCHLNLSSVQYLIRRFGEGYDMFFQRQMESCTPEVEAERMSLAAKYGKYGRKVRSCLSRYMKEGVAYYEVEWEGLTDSKQNTFEPFEKLRMMKADGFARALDARLASQSHQRALSKREIHGHLLAFGISSDLADQNLSTMSAGQLAKLTLAAACWTKPHILLLDEPSNFLDMSSLKSLERALRFFKGGVLVVSHNQEFLENICKTRWLVENKNVTESAFEAWNEPV